MSAAPEVKSAGADNRASAISTIVLGFAADPMARFAWPDPSVYLRTMPRMVNAFGGRAFELGTAYITEGARAAALWLPPGVEPDEAEMDAIMEESLSPEISGDIGAIMKGMAEHHPHEPHWYLPLIAADPKWIGQGLGSLLMKHALRRCDEEGIAAYLESSNPRNISLYERHGFKITGRIQSGSSPVVTPMLRPAS
ncbi:N-acetyltransferase [Bradyrhizobium sp. LMTR 3]|uniref:GNAT family N-acetyltransferase n=1 Tax=Bradyrhizobium sp. LMTR 3 TaxID=189873 RepID=UPI000810A2F3|nr:N-acetyltransferase [Bradyrhizobium sp. LMTR 3]OCK55535.1 acetyltransferase [Bradyrhizobium sp. LMTR 3]